MKRSFDPLGRHFFGLSAGSGSSPNTSLARILNRQRTHWVKFPKLSFFIALSSRTFSALFANRSVVDGFGVLPMRCVLRLARAESTILSAKHSKCAQLCFNERSSSIRPLRRVVPWAIDTKRECQVSPAELFAGLQPEVQPVDGMRACLLIVGLVAGGGELIRIAFQSSSLYVADSEKKRGRGEQQTLTRPLTVPVSDHRTRLVDLSYRCHCCNVDFFSRLPARCSWRNSSRLENRQMQTIRPP